MRKIIPLGIIAAAVAVLTLIRPQPAVAQAQRPGPPENAERIATLAKPAVTRLIAGCRATYVWTKGNANRSYRVSAINWETAFFVNPNGYLLTSADAVYYSKLGATDCREVLFRRYVRRVAYDYGDKMDVDRVTQQQYNNVYNEVKQYSRTDSFSMINTVRLPNGKDLPFEIKTYGAPAGQGKDVAVLKVETRNAPVLKVADSDAVRLQEQVTVAGYPWAADTEDGTLSDDSFMQASFTNGRVSSIKNAADGSKIIQISAPVTKGNSGGPVLNEAGQVIGLYAFQGDQVYQQDVQGFNFAVGSNTAMEFVRQAGTTNEEGPTDAAYREGMELYWKGKYTDAIAKFQEVKNLFPQHGETDKLIQTAQELKTVHGDVIDPTPVPAAPAPAIKKGGTSMARMGAIGALGTAGLAAAAGAVFLVTQNKRRASTAFAGPASLPEPRPGTYNTPWPPAPSGPASQGAEVRPFQQAQSNGQPEPAVYREARGPVFTPPARTPEPRAGGSSPNGPSDVPSTVQLSRGGPCSNCGTVLRPGAQFCSGCGARFGA
jgi:serine protease Do